MAEPRSSGTNNKPPSADAAGVRFNPVQREEPAPAVLTPQVDSAMRRRRAVFLALALAAVALLLFVSINRVGVQTQGSAGSKGPERFGPPPTPTSVP